MSLSVRTKRIGVTLICIICIVLLASCSRRNTSSQTRVIEFMHWETSPKGSRFIAQMIEEFEKENPNIKVRNVATPSGSGQYSSKLLTRFGGGTAPDVFEIQAEMIHPFLRKNLLLNLTPHFEKSTAIDIEDFFPISLVNFRYDGKEFRKGDIYGLPKDIGTKALIYNKDLFDKAGIAYPNDSWTLKEYLEAARKLTVRDSAGRALQIGIDRPIDHTALDLVINNGGRIWSEDYKRCLLDSDKAVKAFQFLYDLREVHQCTLKARETAGNMQNAIGFRSGRAGMSTIFRFELPDEIKYIGNKFRWDICRLPLVNGSRKQLFLGPSGWSAAATTKHPKECIKFIVFLASKRSQIATAELGWNIPADKKVAYSPNFLRNLGRPDSERINRVFLDQLGDMDATLLNPYISIERALTILETNTDANVVKSNEGKVGDLLKKAVKEINAIIGESHHNIRT